jgi:integrase
MRKEITIKSIAGLGQEGGRITDSKIRGFVARCLPSGKIQFGYQYGSRQARRWMKIGLLGEVSVAEARRRAEKYAGQVSDHRDPAAELKTKVARSENTVDHVLDKFLEIYVPQKKLRSTTAIVGAFTRYIRPAIGGEVIYDLDRADITRMLDKIADDHPRMADVTLAYLRKAFNWWQTRDGKFKTPIVIGMARTSTKERARSRTLSDDELRAIWKATEGQGAFDALFRFLLLTGARRTEASAMTWGELDGTDWTLPAARNKTKLDLVRPLSKAAQKVMPAKAGRHVFSTDGGQTSISGFSKFKTQLDKKSGVTGWTPHDLRRTARSLMSRAGVPSDHAERCLGHVIGGVRGVYDRYEYHQEKTDAYQKLANLIDGIVHPRPPNIVPLWKRAKRRSASSPA